MWEFPRPAQLFGLISRRNCATGMDAEGWHVAETLQATVGYWAFVVLVTSDDKNYQIATSALRSNSHYAKQLGCQLLGHCSQ